MKRLLIPAILFVLFPACPDKKALSDHKIKVIVFDFDGTLADTLSLTIKCINTLSSDFGLKPIENKEEIEEFRKSSILKIIKEKLGWRLYLLPGLVIKAKEIFKENRKDIKIFDGVRDLLTILATKYELAIITSSSEETVRQTLEKYEISSLIKEVYSDSSLFGKDAVIKRFLDAHKLEPDEIIYVGDEIRDIDACKNVGVKIISVTWGYNSKSILATSNPDFLVDSYKELENIMALALA